MKITFQKSKTEIPLIKFWLPDNDTPFIALIDTGSEITLADNEFVKSNNITKGTNGTINIQSLNGKTSNVVTKMDIDVLLKGYRSKKIYPISCLTTDLSPISAQLNHQYNENITLSMIIGSNFLNEIKADIDYKNRIISINS